jgi:hypothetical protein
LIRLTYLPHWPDFPDAGYCMGSPPRPPKPIETCGAWRNGCGALAVFPDSRGWGDLLAFTADSDDPHPYPARAQTFGPVGVMPSDTVGMPPSDSCGARGRVFLARGAVRVRLAGRAYRRPPYARGPCRKSWMRRATVPTRCPKSLHHLMQENGTPNRGTRRPWLSMAAYAGGALLSGGNHGRLSS